MAFMDVARAQVKLERVKRPQVKARSVPLAKAMQQAVWPAQQVRAPKANQPVEPRQFLENRQEQVKLLRQETAPVVWQWDPQAPVFALKGQWSSAPLRD